MSTTGPARPDGSAHPPRPERPPGALSVLGERNYRRFVTGQMISLVGTWTQRVAQDWLVLELSGRNPVALGIATALQFLPVLFLSLWAGVLADRLDKRRALAVLQALMGLCALALGLLDVTGAVRLWHVYLLCLLFGCLSAIDAPVFESFVVELVGKDRVSGAIAVNSMTFNIARIAGPAIAGPLIAWVGTGWAFLGNAASYAAVLAGLLLTDPARLHRTELVPRAPGQLAEGLRYVRGRLDLVLLLVMALVIGVCGNFSTSLAVATTEVFRLGPDGYGVMSALLAAGMLSGALLATRSGGHGGAPRRRRMFLSALAVGLLEAGLGLSPAPWLFGLLLTGAGAALTLFVTSAHSTVQIAVDPALRGRVMGLYMLVLLGGTPVNGPLTGWLADELGGRAPFLAGGILCLAAAVVCGLVLRRRERTDPVRAAAAPPAAEPVAGD